jgi:hypothetical protein
VGYYYDSSGNVHGFKTSITQTSVKLGPVLFLSNGTVQVGVTGLTGENYTIQVSTNLVNWDSLTNTTSGQFIDPFATNYPSRFYRAMVP